MVLCTFSLIHPIAAPSKRPPNSGASRGPDIANISWASTIEFPPHRNRHRQETSFIHAVPWGEPRQGKAPREYPFQAFMNSSGPMIRREQSLTSRESSSHGGFRRHNRWMPLHLFAGCIHAKNVAGWSFIQCTAKQWVRYPQSSATPHLE